MSLSAAHVLCFSLVALSTALLTAADLSLSPLLLIDCLCLRSFRPVCGTDQQTYDNICFLHCAKRLNAELRLAYDGVCCPRAELCTDYEDTVCDQFGVRYDNDCVFEFHKCIRRRRIGGEALRVVGRGEQMCGTKRRVAASEQRAATMASTARPSAASLWSSNGTARANGTTNSSTFSCDFPCENAVAPVCDSQGQTHQNRCKFDLAICRLNSRGIVSALRISRDGPCPTGDQQQQIAKTEKHGDKLGEDDAKGSKTIRTIAERTEKGSPNTNDQQKQQQPSDQRQQSSDQRQQSSDQRQQSSDQRQQSSDQRQQSSDQRQQSSDQRQQSSDQRQQSSDQRQQSSDQRQQSSDQRQQSSDRRQQSSDQRQQSSDQRQQSSDDSSFWPPFFHKGISLEEDQRQLKVPKTTECDFCREETPFGQNASLCDNANSTHQSLCSFARWNCERKKRGTEEKIFVHLGECHLVSPVFQLKDEKCPTKCSRKVKAVCDSNGLSHPNLCAYQMHSCLQRKNGRPFGWLLSLRECKQRNGTKIEPKATDKKGNGGEKNAIECPVEPKCEGMTEKQQKAEEGAEEEGPICDSNGRTHKNICMFAHAHCLAAKDGQLLRIVPIERCEHSLPKVPGETFSRRGDSQTTDKTEDKMGGNNGECERKLALCKRNTTEQQLHTVDDGAPYCGTDFITYRTSCDFQLAQCKSDNKLGLLFKGPCELCLAKECHRSDRFSITVDDDDSHFVCDQNGETLSRCEFEMLRCVVQTNLGYNVTFTHEGKCCPTEAKCPPAKMPSNSLEEVCDSNGRRHQSRCQFEVAKCRAKKVERETKPLEERYCPSEELGKGGREGKCEEEEKTEGRGGEEKRGDGTGAREEEEGKEKGGGKWEEEEGKEKGGGKGGGERGTGRGAEKEEREEQTNESADHLSKVSIRSEMNISADLLSVDHLICNAKYDPVCGSDKRTYRNACHLERRNATGTLSATRHRWASATATDPAGESDGWAPLRVLYPGECCPVVDCPAEYAPVCDSEGRTHLNLCEFGYQRCLAERMRARNVTIAFYGLCPDSHCPRGPCPGIFEPICATNGKTYQSLCELDKTICLLKSGGETARKNGGEMADSVPSGGSLGLDYIGECCESSVDCSDLSAAALHFRSMCDSRGTTHSDACAFRRAKCRAKRRREPLELRIIRRGKCERRRRK
ncbi:hypothetical protein niasHS_002732 [Heterodera schachtii]|uniref:Kazal-like domain-containing protein n=1 Tax=Heterodera schachtii TaxID=97005 RepID=A0ABD2K2A4_HETSC